jgi:uncharacterized protein YuzE
MKLRYDQEVDVLLIELREGAYANSEEVAPGMIVDFDEQGQPLRIEILNAHDILDMEGGFKLEILPVVLKRSA